MVPMGFATINDLYLTNEHSSGVYMTLHVERKSVHVFALIDWPLIWILERNVPLSTSLMVTGSKSFSERQHPNGDTRKGT